MLRRTPIRFAALVLVVIAATSMLAFLDPGNAHAGAPGRCADRMIAPVLIVSAPVCVATKHALDAPAAALMRTIAAQRLAQA